MYSCLTLPFLALPCLGLPCLVLSCLVLPCPVLSCLALPCLVSTSLCQARSGGRGPHRRHESRRAEGPSKYPVGAAGHRELGSFGGIAAPDEPGRAEEGRGSLRDRHVPGDPRNTPGEVIREGGRRARISSTQRAENHHPGPREMSESRGLWNRSASSIAA
jgi:hypothetical protein